MARGDSLSPGVGLERFMDLVQRILGTCPRKQQFPTPEKETEAWKHDRTAACAVHTSNWNSLGHFLPSSITWTQGFSTNSQLPKAQQVSLLILDRAHRLHKIPSRVSSLSDPDGSPMTIVSIVLRTFEHQHFRCLQGDGNSCTASERALDLWRLSFPRGSLEEGERYGCWAPKLERDEGFSSYGIHRYSQHGTVDDWTGTSCSSQRDRKDEAEQCHFSRIRGLSYRSGFTALVSPPWFHRPGFTALVT